MGGRKGVLRWAWKEKRLLDRCHRDFSGFETPRYKYPHPYVSASCLHSRTALFRGNGLVNIEEGMQKRDTSIRNFLLHVVFVIPTQQDSS